MLHANWSSRAYFSYLANSKHNRCVRIVKRVDRSAGAIHVQGSEFVQFLRKTEGYALYISLGQGQANYCQLNTFCGPTYTLSVVCADRDSKDSNITQKKHVKDTIPVPLPRKDWWA